MGIDLWKQPGQRNGVLERRFSYVLRLQIDLSRAHVNQLRGFSVDFDARPALERVTEADLLRPGLLLQTADLYLRLGSRREARRVYEKALEIDPDNAQAHIGLCRMALRRRNFSAAAHSALAALERVYHDPMAHFLLGIALHGMKEYDRAAEAFRAAIVLNPNFPEAHLRLAALLEKHLGDPASGREHRLMARRMKILSPALADTTEYTAAVVVAPDVVTVETTEMTPLSESLVVVTGLPRSGTSLLMQMLATGGIEVLADGTREADEDNPHGYFEFEPVKNLLRTSDWLLEVRGKAVKIVAPLLVALPPDLACRVVLCERDLEEVLDSQERMLLRRGRPVPTPERRRMLKNEYARTLDRVRAMLARRPRTRLLVIEHALAMGDPLAAAYKISDFLGRGLDVANVAAAIDPTLHHHSNCRQGPEQAAPVRRRMAKTGGK